MAKGALEGTYMAGKRNVEQKQKALIGSTLEDICGFDIEHIQTQKCTRPPLLRSRAH